MSITVVYYKYAFLIFQRLISTIHTFFLYISHIFYNQHHFICFIYNQTTILSHFQTYVYMFPQNLLQHFVASIALTLYLCYTTSTSNFGHDIFIMFQRPWKSPASISFLNFIAFSAKNSLRFLMMLLIHRNFKCPCTCTSCMHTGQMLRYF